ncbi:hypothetical protein KZZ52_10435 [Dactylosporangium sp. AC04546]|uniref:DUF7674 family protein n=1 Tax=Dactylosporangium sp. AC04546 TaxID=2862460 RepID=UPI001EDF2456|nr:hypothetical protein [Dactylosporangium sp. AC04546]WVK85775.1 hypothetical protein KZZ52_10435 [Dactylosporangium sp. AC04546]
MTTANEFVEAFVARFPALRPSYEEHLRDNGELLPHVIFGIGEGFTDRIVEAYVNGESDALDWRGALAFLDAHFDRGDRRIDEVLVTDFLDALPGPHHPGHGLVEELPHRLRTRFDLIRPSG